MDLDFAIEHLPRLLKAAKLTIELTLLSLFFLILVESWGFLWDFLFCLCIQCVLHQSQEKLMS